MPVNRTNRIQTLVTSIVSGLALTLLAGSEPEEPVLESAIVSGGGIVLDGGAVAMSGQLVVGTASNVSVGYVYVVEEQLVNCPADLNGDAVVNAADLAQLLGAWTPAEVPACDGAVPCPPDLNADGVVNAADLAQLLGSWGPCI